MFDYTKNTGQTAVGGGPLTPHPDGKAWSKCCQKNSDSTSCAFIHTQKHGARLTISQGSQHHCYDGKLCVVANETPFMCCHRSTDDGYYRVCAGWDACFGNKKLTATEKSHADTATAVPVLP